MDFDFKVNKLELEQQRRRESIKKQKEKEDRLKQQQLLREEKEREEAILRREREEEVKIERERNEIEERIKNGGIKFKVTLKPVLIPFEDDKIILPESALIELNQLDAMSRGVLLFEIKTVSSNVSIIQFTDNIRKITHCGVREFSANSGTVGLPIKVIDSLDLDVNNFANVMISVKYVRLPKITYVKFEPKLNEFFNVGPVKICLEENLRQHATLTVGDVITVWYKGKSHVLSVADMKPDPQGTLIDTDVEVDLDFSAEYKKLQENSFKIPQDNSTSNKVSTGNRLGTKLEDTNMNINDNNNNSNSNNNNDNNKKITVLDIPAEPDENEKDKVVKIKLKLPNNGLGSRCFYTNQPIKHLFLYVSSITNIDFNKIQLKAQFPTRLLNSTTVDMEKLLTEYGFHEGQEVLYVS
jgi:hypothetical protein